MGAHTSTTTKIHRQYMVTQRMKKHVAVIADQRRSTCARQENTTRQRDGQSLNPNEGLAEGKQD